MTRNLIVAMENTLFSERSLDWNARCAAIAEAGFGGVYAVPYPLSDDDFHRLRNLADVPKRHGLELSAAYANIDLALPPEHPVNARVARLFAEQNGAPRVELSFKCSDPGALPSDVDSALLSRLAPLLEIAERRGFDLALYPHSFYPLEAPAHAARIVDKSGHSRLRYVFALSHVYAVSTPEDTLAQLRACAAEIVSFNLCGCRRSAPGPRARCLHFPPDEGELEIKALLDVLRGTGYTSDLIVQGHGWTGGKAGLLRSAQFLTKFS